MVCPMLVPRIAATIRTTTAMIPRYSTEVCPLSERALMRRIAVSCQPLTRTRVAVAALTAMSLVMMNPSSDACPGPGRTVGDTKKVRRNTGPGRGSEGPFPDPQEKAGLVGASPRKRLPRLSHGAPCPATSRSPHSGSAPGVELGEDPVDVVLDGLLADEATRRDLMVGHAAGDQLHHLFLPLAEPYENCPTFGCNCEDF